MELWFVHRVQRAAPSTPMLKLIRCRPLLIAVAAWLWWLAGPTLAAPPVVANASPEAVALLDYLYQISGKHTLVGQHCAPLVGSTRLAVAFRATNRYPAVFGQDFGFSPPGTWDGINFRQQIVDEAIRRWNEGFIITLMWHAVRPTEDEPGEFSSSVQGPLSQEDWERLITPGTEVNDRWKAQVDVVASYLRQLRDAGVPVLWRPYHEMNGKWFWWGQRGGEYGYKKLYRMLFERLVHFHRLTNLIWVFNTNEVRTDVDAQGTGHPVHGYDVYYPGADVVDVLATDVYRTNFAPQVYNDLLALAGDKLIALGEVGKVPSPDVLRDQPRWVWFMHWGDPVGYGPDRAVFVQTYQSDAALTLDELPWAKFKEPRTHSPVLR